MGSSIPMPRFALFASLLVSFTKAQTAYESIFTLGAFSLQETCVQSCFTQGYANIDCYTDVLGSMIGCPNSPCSTKFAAVDGCYCRGDLQAVAHDMLSTCIDQMCTLGDNSVNLASAASIYSGYCTGRGFMALPAQNTAETSSSNGFSASTTGSTRSGPTSASSTSSLSTTSSSSASTNNTMIVALAILGGVAAIAILVAAISCRKIRQNKKLAYPGPVNLGSWPNNPSTQQLRPQGGSRHSDGATEIHPNDSASQVNQSAIMGPSYPNYSVPPSAISTNTLGYGPSTVGPGRTFPRY